MITRVLVESTCTDKLQHHHHPADMKVQNKPPDNVLVSMTSTSVASLLHRCHMLLLSKYCCTPYISVKRIFKLERYILISCI